MRCHRRGRCRAHAGRAGQLPSAREYRERRSAPVRASGLHPLWSRAHAYRLRHGRTATDFYGRTLAMILRQFLHTDPVGISYLFGCGGKATGAVVDPVADIDTYLDAARAAGMKIDYVIDTHVHADHISTGRAL